MEKEAAANAFGRGSRCDRTRARAGRGDYGGVGSPATAFQGQGLLLQHVAYLGRHQVSRTQTALRCGGSIGGALIDYGYGTEREPYLATGLEPRDKPIMEGLLSRRCGEIVSFGPPGSPSRPKLPGWRGVICGQATATLRRACRGVLT